MIIISGTMPGATGVGRVLSLLEKEVSALPEENVLCVWGSSGAGPLKALRNLKPLAFLQAVWRTIEGQYRITRFLTDPSLFDPAETVVLIHPQSLGHLWRRRFMEKRGANTWLYLMDCGFFCARSYNHIPTEPEACLRCVGGHWHYAKEFQCPTYPFSNFRAQELLDDLREWVSGKKIRLIAQNRRQSDLAHRHFGKDLDIPVVGLWIEELPDFKDLSLPAVPQKGKYDVVYHAAPFTAKGFIWAVDLARHCPELNFLFPCFPSSAHQLNSPPPRNAHFEHITWETGLKEALSECSVTLVPSLWSAPIEGALVKSIIFAQSVAVVKEPTGFANELPNGLVLQLDKDVSIAAITLRKSIESGWKPSGELVRSWVEGFYDTNRDLLKRLISTCKSG
jgi:hypothetical protein